MATTSNNVKLVKCTYRQYAELINSGSSVDNHSFTPNEFTYILEPRTTMPINVGYYSINDNLAHDAILYVYMIDDNFQNKSWLLSDGSHYLIYFTFMFDSTYVATSPLIDIQSIHDIDGASYFRIETPTGYIKFKLDWYHNNSDHKYYLRLSDEYFTDKTLLDAIDVWAIPVLCQTTIPEDLLNL